MSKRNQVIIFGKTNLKIDFIHIKKNLGLAKSITKALDKYSKIYENLIIIEDDCIPRKEFFKFMISSLKKFEKDETVGAICGYQLPNLQTNNNKTMSILKLDNFIPWGWSLKTANWNKYRKQDKKFYNKKSILKKIKSKVIRKLLKIEGKLKYLVIKIYYL